MATVREIYQYLDGLAPFSLQMEFDNAGFLVGRGERAVSKILVSLDITEEVAEEAAELGAELIVAAKPLRPTLKICRRQIFFTLRWSRSGCKAVPVA